jgi:hypothetical protein
MSRQLEQDSEDRDRRRRLNLWVACTGGLEDAVSYGGGQLRGFSARLSRGECLLVLRADFPGNHMVAFVGAESLSSAILKAEREAKSDHLKWRVDRYAKK